MQESTPDITSGAQGDLGVRFNRRNLESLIQPWLSRRGAHCCVIAPRKLDEQRTGVKTDPRDAITTREILERDGKSPHQAYAAFRDYAADIPVSAYGLDYDWDSVLDPEWRRLA